MQYSFRLYMENCLLWRRSFWYGVTWQSNPLCRCWNNSANMRNVLHILCKLLWVKHIEMYIPFAWGYHVVTGYYTTHCQKKLDKARGNTQIENPQMWKCCETVNIFFKKNHIKICLVHDTAIPFQAYWISFTFPWTSGGISALHQFM